MRIEIYCSDAIVTHEDARGCAILSAPAWARAASHRDDRLGRLCARLREDHVAALRDADWLDLDYALAVTCRRSGTLHVAVGPRGGNRWYVRAEGNVLRLYDRLVSAIDSVPSPDDVSNERLVDFFANAASVGPFDLASGNSATLRSYQTIRRGCYRAWREGQAVEEFCAIHQEPQRTEIRELPRQDAIQSVRDAVDQHLERVCASPVAAVEVSGGIDSGIVFARLIATRGLDRVVPISMEYPYPEFSRESRFRAGLLAMHRARSLPLAGNELLPFANLEELPAHDEPAALLSAWNQSRLANRAAHEHGAAVLFTGQGGDRLFATLPDGIAPALPRIELPAWMSTTLQQAIRSRATAWRAEYLNANALCDPPLSALESPWMNRYARASPEQEYCSGLVSRAVVRALQAVRGHYTGAREWRCQKPLAHAIFGEALPDNVWTREGKVNHLGLIYRGARLNRECINDHVRAGAAALEPSGVERRGLLKAVEGLTSGVRSAEPMTNAAISICVWFAKLRRAAGARVERSPVAIWEV